jgi:hypothetical protein
MVQPGMLFAMIFTIIIIGFIFAVGFSQIQDFFCLGSNVQTRKAVKDIESIVDEVFVLAAGSAKTYSLSLPSGAKICFVNKDYPGPQPNPDPATNWNPDRLVLENFLENPNSPQYGSNLWIYFCGNPLGEGYKMKYLSPSKSFCAVSGHKLFLENKGSFVNIKPL